MRSTYTITCHNVYNYGASLQAYALQQYLLAKNVKNEIINYMPSYLNWHCHFKWWISPKSSYYGKVRFNPLLRLLYVTIRYLVDLRTYSRKRNFDRFTSKYLKLTKLCRDKREIDNIVTDANILIAGSDQIWNSYNLINGSDPAFYLSFGPHNAKRISYAASFGANQIDEKLEDFVKSNLDKFCKISVREQSGVEVLKKLGFQSDVVLDPVFLLSKEEWLHKLDIKTNNQEYILIYNLGEENREIYEFAKTLHEVTGLKIISIFGKVHLRWCDEIQDAGPIEFLSMIYNASYIITNSFHASAFSIIFKKEFFSFSYNKSKASTRIYEMLKSYNLLNRYNPNQDVIILNSIDYDIIEEKLESSISFSKKWLESVLN